MTHHGLSYQKTTGEVILAHIPGQEGIDRINKVIDRALNIPDTFVRWWLADDGRWRFHAVHFPKNREDTHEVEVAWKVFCKTEFDIDY